MRRCPTVAVITVIVALLFGQQAAAVGATAAAPRVPPRSAAGLAVAARLKSRLAVAVPARVPAGDELITGSPDAGGYHLFAAAAGDGWAWHPLATLLPAGDDQEKWIGQQCLTGDGRFVVAVVAPWHAANNEGGMDSGGYAYAVDAHTGAVRPLAAGVSLAYFNPSCGAGGDVTLTTYLGHDQRPTGISVLEAGSGRTVASTVVPGEITSAVWAGGRILAARGRQLVDVTGDAVRVAAQLPGGVAEIRAAAAGGVDLIAEGASTSGVWRWTSRGAALVGRGAAGDLHIFVGRGGRNVVVGASRIGTSAGLAAGPAAAGIEGVSLGGAMAQVQTRTPAGTRAPRPGQISVQARDARTPAAAALPSAAVAKTTAVPAVWLAAAGAARPLSPMTSSPASPASPARDVRTAAQAVTSAYSCAVPRNDIFKQVMQPTSDQVRWAVNQAVQGALAPPYTQQARPVDNGQYTVNDASYTPLPTAYPDQDFPLVPGAPAVPPLVMYGILAQESNWQQASRHAVPGRAGNPLVSNYYGSYVNGGPPIDYGSADCGYGIGQITDGMQLDPGVSTPTDLQVRVAVDYATNIAAAVRTLQGKWMELHQLGITTNNDDPTKVENWYAAIWAYNSGVHNDPTGQEGLGWFNNPANKMYPVRHTFLHAGVNQTLDDASHPNDWPYQERVFGWMEVPLVGSDGLLDYRGTFDWDTGAGNFLTTPAADAFCAPNVNGCDPAQVGTGNDPCPSEDGSCYWDAPMNWTNCATECDTDTVTDAPNGHTYHTTPGDPEPLVTPAAAACGTSGLSPGPSAIVVDDETLDPTKNPAGLTPNLQGCSLASAGLIPPASAHASFQIQDSSLNDVTTTPSSLAAIDVHQLGGGLGGHLFFTHTGPAGQAAAESRGVWSATLAASPAYGSAYEIKAFIPDIGAGSGHATYEISTSGAQGAVPGRENSGLTDDSGRPILARTINQGAYANQWVSLGYYLCGGPASQGGAGPSSCTMRVTLRSLTPAGDPTQGADIAFDAMAFVPVPAGGYVALGDSYSSGEGAFYPSDPSIPDGYDDGTDVAASAPGESGGNGDLCHRSSMSWPRLLAAAKGLPIVELACSGSNLGDVTGATYWLDQSKTYFLGGKAGFALNILNDGSVSTVSRSGWTPDLPNSAGSAFFGEPTYQLELLRALRPKLVTVTIGGNDLGFADILESCITRAPCKPSFLNASGPDKLDKRISSLQPLLTNAYAAIKAAAGTGNVYALTYPAPLTPDGSGDDCTFIQPGDRAWLASKVATMAAAITSAAQQAGVKHIDISTLFNGHGPCATDAVPYVNPPDFRPLGACTTKSCMDTWFHPNKFGYQAIEAAIVSKISAS
jgi:lysophospholipase L1-like esterase